MKDIRAHLTQWEATQTDRQTLRETDNDSDRDNDGDAVKGQGTILMPSTSIIRKELPDSDSNSDRESNGQSEDAVKVKVSVLKAIEKALRMLDRWFKMFY